MLRRALRYLQIVARFGFPLMLVVLIAMPFVERANPWAVADAQVPHRSGQSRVMVGAGIRSRSSYNPSESGTERHADYVYFPNVLSTKTMYRVSQDVRGTVTTTTERFSVVATVVGLLLAVALTVISWVRPLPGKSV